MNQGQPVGIKGLAHVCIMASDLVAAERFYCGVLGFTKVFEFVKQGNVFGFYLRVSGRTYLEVFQDAHLEASANSPIRHLCFEVEDIKKARAALVAKGVEVTDPYLAADHSWQVWITDPHGVKIELHQYTAESCQVTGSPCVFT